MDSPQSAPTPRAPHAPLSRSQRAGLLLSVVCLACAWAASTPLGRAWWPEPALPVLAFFASAGSILCAIGLALRQPAAAWSGAGAFAFIALAVPPFWYAVPPAVALLGCVLAWEAGRPRLPPPPVPAWVHQPPPPGPPPPGWRQA